MVDRCRQIVSTQQVEPFLHIIMKTEASLLAFSICQKECIEVELVKLPIIRHGSNGRWQLIGHQHHSRERGIGVHPLGLRRIHRSITLRG